MATAVKISAEPRSGKSGSAESNRLRKSGYFPGVVYGAGKDVQLVQVYEHAFHQALVGHHSEHVMLDLEIQGQEVKKVLLQEVQHNPLNGSILHADFHEVSMTETLVVEVSVEPVGTPVGVSMQGGLLEQSSRILEIECLPGDLMEFIQVDISGMNVGDVLTAGDVQLDAAKYKVVTDPEQALFVVTAPKVDEDSTAEGAEATEPVVLKEKKTESEEG
ncbi:MAG: 50S ribosomal protein L25 [Verrucomicrobia bacterium]|nr:50S ribosomal protein L25 [Verrucomicrobiota bacterium]